MGLPLISPKMQFFDSNGDPLVGGKLYTKEAGGGSNKATYTTAALSTPNANPIILDARGECTAYGAAGDTYWLRLTTSADVTLWTEDNVSFGYRYDRTAEEISAGIVPTDYTYPVGDVRRYGAVGDGATDDRTACQDAIDVGGDVTFDGGTFFLGTLNSGSFLTPVANGQRFIFKGGAVLKANGNGGVTNTASILYIDGFSDIVVENPSFLSNWGVDSDRDAPYAIGLGCVNGYTRHITIINPKARLCQALIQCTKETYNDSYEVEGVEFVNGYADNCYYGTGWSRTGNGVKGSYRTLNAHRAVFLTSVHSHDLTVVDHHDGTVASPTSYLHQSILSAGSFTGSIPAKDLYNIRLRYRASGAQYTNIPFLFSITHTTGDTRLGVAYDIHVTYNDRGSTISNSIGFIYYLDGTPQASYTGQAWNRITLDGYANNPFNLTAAGGIGAPVVQTVTGTLEIGQLNMAAAPSGVNNPHRATLFTAGSIFNEAASGTFTPTVQGSGTAGTVTYSAVRTGTWRRQGQTIFFDLAVGWTNIVGGVGSLQISGLPTTALNNTDYTAVCQIMATNLTFAGQLAAGINSNTSVIQLYEVATGAALAALAIDTAATVYISGTYQTN